MVLYPSRVVRGGWLRVLRPRRNGLADEDSAWRAVSAAAVRSRSFESRPSPSELAYSRVAGTSHLSVARGRRQLYILRYPGRYEPPNAGLAGSLGLVGRGQSVHNYEIGAETPGNDARVRHPAEDGDLSMSTQDR